MEDLDEPVDILPKKLVELIELVRACCPGHQNISIKPLGYFRICVSHDNGFLMITLNPQKTVTSWSEAIANCLRPHKIPKNEDTYGL